jgi:hypothetical protein
VFLCVRRLHTVVMVGDPSSELTHGLKSFLRCLIPFAISVRLKRERVVQ